MAIFHRESFSHPTVGQRAFCWVGFFGPPFAGGLDFKNPLSVIQAAFFLFLGGRNTRNPEISKLELCFFWGVKNLNTTRCVILFKGLEKLDTVNALF